MRIGIDGRFWNESGVGRYIRNLVREIDKFEKIDEFVLFVNSEVNGKKHELNKHYHVGKNWTIVPTEIHWHTLSEQLEFPKLLNSYNLDLVHFPYFSVPILYNRPFVVTIHDLILHHFATGNATTLPKPVYMAKLQGYKFVLRQAARRSKKIITVSEATQKEIVTHLGVAKDKVIVIYEGANLENAKHDRYTGIPAKEKYFLYVGNAYPHKNLDVLFRAFSELGDTKVKLIVVGREDFFQKRAVGISRDSYKNPNIIFKTHVDDNELSTLYQNALALVSTSLMEGFGLPLVEAMKLGCVVVASDISSSREVCKHAALYFDPGKVESLRQTLESVLLGKINKEKLVAGGYEQSKLFSWEKMARQTYNVYTSAV